MLTEDVGPKLEVIPLGDELLDWRLHDSPIAQTRKNYLRQYLT